MHLGLNVSSSTHNCGCMVDGGNAVAAIFVYQSNSNCMGGACELLTFLKIVFEVDSYVFKD